MVEALIMGGDIWPPGSTVKPKRDDQPNHRTTPGPDIGGNIVASGSDKLLVQVDITAGSAFLFVKNPNWQPVFDVDKPLVDQI